ncbi:DUF6531 domain-containing protein [Streptomyces sp. NPDC051776]|uniref:DUF6531 domain-containing protein n=1 Tax=Streptomyces sp. NPDC051776 TaxID=3155414 RepID=UPI00344A1BDA
MIIGGPILGAIVLIAALVVLADTLNKYLNGQATLWDVAFAALDCIPGMKGLTTLGGLAKGMKALSMGKVGLKSMALGVKGLAKSGRGMLADGAKGAYNRLKNVVRSKGSDPVDMATGKMFLPQTDIQLPGLLPLAFERRVESGYAAGQWFGPSWTSTVDQRLEIDAQGVVFITEDGLILDYPHPEGPDASVLSENGPRWPLSRNEDGGYCITDVVAGHTRWFAKPSAGIARLDRISDRNGHEIVFHYETDGAPTAIRHSGGYDLKLTTEEGRVTALALAGAGEGGSDVTIKRYGYTDGNLTEVFNSSDLPLRFGYDGRLRITSWTDTNGRRYEYEYDERDRCVAEGGEAGHIAVTLAYDGIDSDWPDLRVTLLTTAEGATSRFVINDACQVVAEIDACGGVTRTEYDRHHHVVSWTDPLGCTTRFANDKNGQPLLVTYPDGGTTRYAYDDLARPTCVTLADGTMWRREYDARGNCTAVIDASGAVLRYGFDESGRLTAITDALGNTTQARCDRAGLVVELTDPLGNRMVGQRDAFGRMSVVTDPMGAVTRRYWTVAGNIARTLAPDGTEESWEYDGEGNCVRHEGANGGVTTYEYTHFDLLTARTGPDGARYEFEHDASLRLRKVMDPRGLTWDYEYDPAGRLVAEVDFDGRRITYQRSATGRVTQRTNPLGQTVAYEYDSVGRLTSKHADGVRTTYEHSRVGMMVSAKNPDCEVSWERDALGRPVAEWVNGQKLSLDYDVTGRLAERVTPANVRTSYRYDAVGRRAALNFSGHTIDFTRDAAGRETQRLIGESLTLAQVWDPAGKLAARTVRTAGELVQHRAYSYRPDGHLLGVDDLLTGATDFSVDGAGRVTAVSARDWQEEYAYDLSGNQIHAAWPGRHPGEDAQGDRTYDGTLLTKAGRVRYEYDAAGRISVRRKTRLSRKPDVWRYSWDAEDRLRSVITPDGTVWRYRYDPFGRRIGKQRLASDAVTVTEQTSFIWDGSNLVEQTTEGPGLLHPVTLTWDYDGLSPIAQAERLTDARNQEEIDSRFFAIVTDLVGAPTELIDESGAVAWRARKSLWGITAWQSSNTAHTPLRFPGQYHDPESGLHYNYHRYYDPEASRYASPDPLGLGPSPNPSSYVNNPHTWSDPLGLSPYPNTMPEKLAGELADAERLGVRPVKVGEEGFDDAINSGKVKWAVTEQGDLVVMPKHVNGVELKHPVLTGGRPVQTAGEADIAGGGGQYFGLELDNNSGHYLPSLESLQIGRDAFERAGISFL